MTTDTTPKLTLKQINFVDAFLECGNESEAYRRAYNAERMSAKAITVEATRLMKHPAITLVLTSRQQALAERHEVTADSIVSGLQKIADDPEAPAAAKVSALMGQARILGHVVDRREVKGNVEHHVNSGANSLSKYTIEQLDALLDAMKEPEALASPPNHVIEGDYTEVSAP